MTPSPDRNWDWFSSSLLFLLIQVVAARLVTTNWASFLFYSETIAALGTILGLALGASRFGHRSVTWLAVGYTLTVLPWQATGAVNDKLFLDRLIHAGQILITSLHQFLLRQPVKDPLFFVSFACIAFWVLSLVAGYWLVRHDIILTAIIPFGIVILTVQVYADYQWYASWWLAAYMLVVLLLIGRVYYRQSQKVWSQRRVFIGEGAWSNILGGLFTTVASAILVAWLIPTSLSSWQSAADTWNNFTKPIRERFSNAVASLNGPYSTASVNFYGPTLALGQNAASGDSTLFTVEVLTPPDFTPRYYWRGRVYDTYASGKWSTTSASNIDFVPTSGSLNIPNAENRSGAVLQFIMRLPTQDLIYAPSQPVWVDRPANVLTIVTDRKLDDVLYWEAKQAVHASEQYEVRSEIANPNIQQLQTADTAYAQWITDHYLEIPDQLRHDFRQLAEKVTAGQNNPFDKAAAITSYLRANLQYSINMPAAPSGQDPIAWVLFDYKRGFCNYYASAEVLMLRSIGIPARLAVGFAQGEYENNTYTVRGRDAHAWPEVYFPGIGWVEFEPTVSQGPIVRPTAAFSTHTTSGAVAKPKKQRGDDEGLTPGNLQSPPQIQPVPFAETIPGRALIIGSLFVTASILVLVLRRYRVWSYVPAYITRTLEAGGWTPPAWIANWSRWNRLQPVERSFASIDWSLHWLGKPQPMDATATERAALLKKLLPIAAGHVEALRSELEAQLFTPVPGDIGRARRAGYFIVYYTVRHRLLLFLGAAYDRDLYSR